MISINQIKSEFGQPVHLYTYHIDDFDSNRSLAINKARAYLITIGGIVFFPKTEHYPPMYWIFKPIDNNKMGETIYTYAHSTIFKTRPHLDTPFEEGDIIENTDSTQDFKHYIYHKNMWQRTSYISVTPHQVTTLDTLPDPNEERVGSLAITNHSQYGMVLSFCIKTERDTYEWVFLPLSNSYFASETNFGCIRVKDASMIKDGVLQYTPPPLNSIYTQYMRENGIFYNEDNPNTLYPNTYWLDISSSVLTEGEKTVKRVYRRTK